MRQPFAGRARVFRDPVHGDLAFPRGKLAALIKALVDTPAFQRLRHIRQNGLMNLVFHGAEHSRFSHSLGVAWTAQTMLDAIERNSAIDIPVETYEDTVLAALLHDVGHGPFSHTLEEIVADQDRTFDHEQDRTFDHEHMTTRILTEETANSRIAQLLEESSPGRSERLCRYIDKSRRGQARWYHSIVSSQLDADRLDYVRRDAAFAGIDNHRPDIKRLIANISIHEDRVVVDHRALDVIESFLLALDHMYESVYFHRGNRAATILLSALLRRAVQVRAMGSPDDPFHQLLTLGNDVPLDTYIRVTDATVWYHLDRWRHSDDHTLRFLASRLLQRTLPKAIELPLRVRHKKLEKIKERARELIAGCVALRGVDPELLLDVDEPERTNYKRYLPGEGSGDSIHIWRKGATSPLAIEQLERSIVSVVIQKFYLPRLFVPPEIHDDLRRYCSDKKLLR